MARERYLQDFLVLLKKNANELAEVLSKEHGKLTPDALGEFQRGFEMVESACNINSMYLGESLENISKNVDCYSFRHPLGVCAGVCAFNFPSMIPLWVTFKILKIY